MQQEPKAEDSRTFSIILHQKDGQKPTAGEVSADAEYHLKIIRVEPSVEETVRAAIHSANSHNSLNCVLGKEGCKKQLKKVGRTNRNFFDALNKFLYGKYRIRLEDQTTKQ